MSYFYKYSSLSTAEKILTSRKFRYSSPLLFNDPFDVQTELNFDFDINSFSENLMNEMEIIASSNKPFNFTIQNEWTQSLESLREHIKKEGVINPQLRTILLSSFNPLKSEMEETRQNHNQLWREFLLPMRVFSVSEKNDDILMWSHYSKNHMGVVFKLRVIPEIDNPLCAAEQIVYEPKPLTFFTLKEWLNDILGFTKIDSDQLFRNYVKVKCDIWQYEAEWRVWSFEWDSKDKLYNDYNVRPEELEAIYFGCNTEKDDIARIKKLCKDINPSSLFFKAKKTIGQYKLEFDEI